MRVEVSLVVGFLNNSLERVLATLSQHVWGDLDSASSSETASESGSEFDFDSNSDIRRQARQGQPGWARSGPSQA